MNKLIGIVAGIVVPGGDMYRSILALMFGFVISGHCLAQQSPVGTYKLVLHDYRFDGKPEEPWGKSPHGYLVITPRVFVLFFTGDVRKPGATAEAKAALLDTLVAYSGPYRIEGNKITVSVDAAWNEAWKGTQQARAFELKGKRLVLITAPQASQKQPGKMFSVRAEFEKLD